MPSTAVDDKTPPKGVLEEGLNSIKQALALGAYDVAANITKLVLKDYPNETTALELAVNVFSEISDIDLAIETQQKLVTLHPKTLEYHKNLVELNINAKAKSEAINACKYALNVFGHSSPSAPWFFENWTKLEINGPKCADPLNLWLKNINVEDDASNHNLSSLLAYAGRMEEALAVYLNHCVKAWDEATELNKGPPENTLEDTYDTMADIYNQNVLDISFGARMADFVTELLGEDKKLIILDAACGTGITGKHLKHIADKLVGFDLSQNMLEKAIELGVYDILLKASFNEMITKLPLYKKTFDVITSSCALYHVPRLDSFFSQSAELLQDNGYLFFSVDPAPDHMDVGITQETPMLEYAHSKKYIRKLGSDFGFSEIEIRVMAHRPNPGFWCAFQKHS